MWIWSKASSAKTKLSHRHRAARTGDLWRRLARSVRAFGQDTNGIILPYVTILLTVIVGVSVLALDGGRYMSLQAQLQKGADALALAGAAELNGLPDSITRATAAIDNTNTSWVSNSSIFGTGTNAKVNITSIVFYSALPAGTVNPIPANDVTTDPTQAKYVQVTATPTTITTILPASFFGGNTSLTTGASAVAGLNEVACGTQPIFICNPFETSGMSYSQATQALVDASSTLTRHEIKITTPPGSAYTAGNYGWIQPDSQGTSNQTCGPGGQTTAQDLATTSPDTCINARLVNLNTGVKTPTLNALNIRFDIFQPPWSSCSSDSNYSTDINVRKGYIGKNCNSALNSPPFTGDNANTKNDAAAVALLHDNCIQTGSCSTSVYGDGNWVCGDSSATTTALLSLLVLTSGGTGQLTVSSTAGIYQGMAVNLPGAFITPGNKAPKDIYVSNVDYTNNIVTIQNNGSSTITITAMVAGTSITFTGYWNTAHGNGSATMPTGCQGSGGSNYASITRYQVYNCENGNPNGDTACTNTSSLLSDKSSGGEVGGPICSSSTSSNRRILVVPVINCESSPVSMNGSATNVPVAAYAKFFMTQPYDGTNAYAEYLGRLTPNSGIAGASLWQSVQLYR